MSWHFDRYTTRVAFLWVCALCPIIHVVQSASSSFSQITIDVALNSTASLQASELESCANAWALGQVDGTFSIHADVVFSTILFSVMSERESGATNLTEGMMTSNAFLCSAVPLHVLHKREGYWPAAVTPSLLAESIDLWPKHLVFGVTAVGGLMLVAQLMLLRLFRWSTEYAWALHHKRERMFF